MRNPFFCTLKPTDALRQPPTIPILTRRSKLWQSTQCPPDLGCHHQNVTKESIVLRRCYRIKHPWKKGKTVVAQITVKGTHPWNQGQYRVRFRGCFGGTWVSETDILEYVGKNPSAYVWVDCESLRELGRIILRRVYGIVVNGKRVVAQITAKRDGCYKARWRGQWLWITRRQIMEYLGTDLNMYGLK